GTTPGPLCTHRNAAGLIFLQNRAFIAGTSVAGVLGHEFNDRTDSDGDTLDDRLSRRGLRLQTPADRSDAPSGARQPHACGGAARVAAGVTAARCAGSR